MHPTSMIEMKKFVDKYMNSEKVLTILDVGSQDVQDFRFGTYRDLCKASTWKYTGIDIVPGKNVDLVVPLYTWPIETESVDIVLSGQCLEHVEDIFAMALEIGRVLKPGGYCCLIVPWSDSLHRHPIDCWRFMPDGMRFFLENKAGLSVLECYHNAPYLDCVGIATKK